MGRHSHSYRKSHHSSSRRSKSKHSRHHRHSKSRKRNRHDYESSTSMSDEYYSSDSESDLNVKKPLLSLIEYLDNKEELIHQVFKTLRGRKLKSMIPDELHKYSFSEIRDMCHDELKIMSPTKIKRLMDGKPLENLSPEPDIKEENEAVTEYAKAEDDEENEFVTQIADSTCDKIDVPKKETCLKSLTNSVIIRDEDTDKLSPTVLSNSSKISPTLSEPNVSSFANSVNKQQNPSPLKENSHNLMQKIDSPATIVSQTEPHYKESSTKSAGICCTDQSNAEQSHISSQIDTIKSDSVEIDSEVASLPTVNKSSDSSPHKDNNSSTQETSEATDDLDTLELELRARAIRSLLKSQMNRTQ